MLTDEVIDGSITGFCQFLALDGAEGCFLPVRHVGDEDHIGGHVAVRLDGQHPVVIDVDVHGVSQLLLFDGAAVVAGSSEGREATLLEGAAQNDFRIAASGEDVLTHILHQRLRQVAGSAAGHGAVSVQRGVPGFVEVGGGPVQRPFHLAGGGRVAGHLHPAQKGVFDVFRQFFCFFGGLVAEFGGTTGSTTGFCYGFLCAGHAELLFLDLHGVVQAHGGGCCFVCRGVAFKLCVFASGGKAVSLPLFGGSLRSVLGKLAVEYGVYGRNVRDYIGQVFPVADALVSFEGIRCNGHFVLLLAKQRRPIVKIAALLCSVE